MHILVSKLYKIMPLSLYKIVESLLPCLKFVYMRENVKKTLSAFLF